MSYLGKPEKVEGLLADLRDIAAYGRANPGYGYSCATKAIEALATYENHNLTANRK